MSGTQSVSLERYEGNDRIVSSIELQARISQQRTEPLIVKSGFPTLDRHIGGFHEGELYAISGPTKNGKTLFAQSLTLNAVERGEFPLWFTYEVPARQFLNQFETLPHFYMPAKLKAYNMEWLSNRIVESFLKYGTRLIFIDHLHYLFDISKTRNTSIEIGSVIRKLKGLCVEHGLCIFILCHTVKGKSDDNLSYESIRDSSFVSQESDSVFMIRRTPNKGEDTAEMRIEFHRRTGVLEKKVKLKKVGRYLQEVVERPEGDKEPWWNK